MLVGNRAMLLWYQDTFIGAMDVRKQRRNVEKNKYILHLYRCMLIIKFHSCSFSIQWYEDNVIWIFPILDSLFKDRVDIK